jgi:hypothetical protein
VVGPDLVHPQVNWFSELLDALIRKQRLAGVECAQQGHDLASKAYASCDEIDFRRIITVASVCRACERVVGVKDQYLYMKFRDPKLRKRAEDDIARELVVKLRAMDRNRRNECPDRSG